MKDSTLEYLKTSDDGSGITLTSETSTLSSVRGMYRTRSSPYDIDNYNYIPGTPTVSVIIPTLNESKNLPHVLPRIPKWVHEVIIVDGLSTDRTLEVALELLPHARIVLETRKGKGVALRTGFMEAKGDIIVMLDADGSMAPEEITVFVGALLAGSDFVKGSRFVQGGGTDDMGYYRYLGNLGLLWIAKLLFGGRYTDLCYGYAAFWKRVLPVLNLKSDGFEIETEMNIRALRARLKIAEVPSFEYDRIHGTSNLDTVRDGFRVLGMILRQFGQSTYQRGNPLIGPTAIRS